MKNEIITYFTQDEVKCIYDALVEYSLRKYEKSDDSYKEMFSDKYEYAKGIIENRLTINDDELKKFLEEEKEKYWKNIEDNKDVIDLYSGVIKNIFYREVDESFTYLEKANYLFDFCAGILKYSEDWYNKCLLTPPKDGFEFDFIDNVPADNDVNGLLVLGQGVCDDFCNLMQYLGRILGLNIGKAFVNYNGVRHSINTIEIDGQTSLIDITRKVRGDMNKEQCFLVSQKELENYGLYEFDSKLNMETVGIDDKLNSNDKYDITNVLSLINSINVKPKYVDIKKTGYTK